MTSTSRLLLVASFALGLAGCAVPVPIPSTLPEEDEMPMVESTPPPEPAPMIEYPPIEPVEPPEEVGKNAPAPEPAAPPTAAQSTPTPPPAPAPAPSTPATTPPATTPSAPAPAAPTPSVPETPTDDMITAGLVADLARFGSLAPEDVRREIGIVTQALTRTRSDANRVRLAMLYTLVRTVPDDQRALQLLENVSKSNPGSAGVKQLANVLHIQVTERLRAVRDEQQKAETAIQKLEALRVMERSLLRDRLRSGGGGAGGGSGGGSGGGAGSGGR